MNLYKHLINYDYVNSFEISSLKKALVLPISNDGIYCKFFVCKNSDHSLLALNLIIEEIEIEQKEIEFFLSDIKSRIKLFKLSKELLRQKEINPLKMEEFFNHLLTKALILRVSDIHFETLEISMLIRFRIDGELKSFYIFEKEFFKSISSYIKMLSRLDITKIRNPQDGRFSFEKIDFRVSTMPTISGESIVIRILDNLNVKDSFDNLNFSSHIIKSFKEILCLKEGLILITGPTGSGKSTTLYSLIKQLNSQNRKIITIEDPVEYKIEQVQQININEEIDLGFKSVLKNILRQDPDIILIGEIRDAFSLSIALQASLTGHLVLASIHANSSIETISRLIDLKADKFLLVSTLRYIISQRLVLKLCTCNEKGCEKCNFKGFLGRIGIAESLKINEKIKKYLMEDDFLIKIENYLKKLNFKRILDDGLKKVEEQKTTLKELYKVISS
ncbi:GspE/PulE family protein [Halarcobacter bivalviorum]|uniref:Transformation system protein n=1 Tax=Halarcobacter bivalviorum TaxID=663364 RepID=A0AAX2A851_9BACT|nr:GspE/PulE family protein [Halarcobacter bivalviorum]AXH13007.1 type II secretion/transformation system, E protein [Halarcobacter bivalviorum]RXK09188.1 transformation system protein [Halarcobacter bivalviorum]